MKNFLLVVATLCAATFLFADTAVAGGGGKGKSDVTVSNVDTVAITVWILDDAQAAQLTAPGVTAGQALSNFPNRNIQPGNVERFSESNGNQTIFAAPTSVIRNPAIANTPITNLPPGIAPAPFVLNRDRTVNVSRAGIVFTN